MSRASSNGILFSIAQGSPGADGPPGRDGAAGVKVNIWGVSLCRGTRKMFCWVSLR